MKPVYSVSQWKCSNLAEEGWWFNVSQPVTAHCRPSVDSNLSRGVETPEQVLRTRRNSLSSIFAVSLSYLRCSKHFSPEICIFFFFYISFLFFCERACAIIDYLFDNMLFSYPNYWLFAFFQINLLQTFIMCFMLLQRVYLSIVSSVSLINWLCKF